MTRLSRIPFLVLLAIFAIGVGSVLPYSPAVAAAQSSLPNEEEKSPAEQDQDSEIKAAHSSNNILPLPTASPTVHERFLPTNSRPIPVRTSPFDPAASLNNGLAAFYRC